MSPIASQLVDKLTIQLMRDESLKLKPYRDEYGNLTIGFGRNLDAKGISRAEAATLLANDIQEAITEVESQLPFVVQLDDVRRAVLFNMCFNLGIAGLVEFRQMLAALVKNDFNAAANAMADSEWAKQVGARATRLEIQMRLGVWQ